MRADVHRRDHAAARIPHRHRDRTQPDLELLVEQRGWGEEVRRWIEDVFVAVLLGLEPDSP